MATFDPAEPQDTSKIRNGPSLIRENFQAINNGDSSFTQSRVNLIDDGIPGTQATMMRMYADFDEANLELFCKDGNGNKSQITKEGQLAGIARASIDSSGGVTDNFGVDSCTHFGTGKYRVVVTSGWLQKDSYQVLVNAVSNSTSNTYVGVIANKPAVNSNTTTSIDIYIWNVSTSSLTDKTFEFLVVGGR
jgi:hypothetical protein